MIDIDTNQIGLYRFSSDFGRHGSLEGVFLASAADIALLRTRRVYFGEVLGKHSEVSVDFRKEPDSVELITEIPEVIEVVQKHGLTSGFDPVYYMHECNEYEDEE